VQLLFHLLALSGYNDFGSFESLEAGIASGDWFVPNNQRLKLEKMGFSYALSEPCYDATTT
jgi:hypothetical protein